MRKSISVPSCKWKPFWLLLGLFLFSAGNLSAQDCNAIVLPLVNNDASRLAHYPADKLAYRCAFSQLSFEVTDILAEGAAVHDISEVKDVLTGVMLDRNVQIDLSVLSYYRYDFNRFQGMHADEYVYFHTPGSEHRYLVLVPRYLAQERAQEKMNN